MILDLDEQDFNLTLSSFELFKTKVLEANALLLRSQVAAGAAVEVARGAASSSDKKSSASSGSAHQNVSKSGAGSLGTSSSSFGSANQTTSNAVPVKVINLLNNTI